MKIKWIMILLTAVACHNPFAPPLTDDDQFGLDNLKPQTTIDGFFETFKLSYAFKDTSIYSRLLSPEFVFTYRDYDKGVDESWGREIEMKTTQGLFINAQQLDLEWQDYLEYQVDSIRAVLSRSFQLTVTFSPTDIVQGDGNARLTLTRRNSSDVWKLNRWVDESNF